MAVVGYEGLYSVSSLGRVRSEERVISRRDGRTQRVHERILVPHPSGPDRAYLFVTLSKGGVQRGHKVHRLVLFAFTGPPDSGQEGCHGPGGSFDNRVLNLRWGTRSENIQDQIDSGSHYSHGRTKTHCPQGHPYEGDNVATSLLRDGYEVRYCRTCKRLKTRERRARKKRPRND